MGYGVDFVGDFKISPSLNDETLQKLEDLIYDENMRYVISDDKLTLGRGIRYKYYIEDLKELIEDILAPNGYKLNGVMSFSEHEDPRNIGFFEVENNRMKIYGYRYKIGNSWFPENPEETDEVSEEKINLLAKESPDISTSSSSTSNKVSKILEVIKSTLTDSEIASVILLLGTNLEKT